MATNGKEARDGDFPIKIGDFEIIEWIQRGGSADIYLAHDVERDQKVALKLIRSEALSDSESGTIHRRLFFSEAACMGRLTHPNIVMLYDAGISDGAYYLALEYIDQGRTLQEYCQPNNLLPVTDVVGIIYSCAKALDYAHRRRIIHRDVKPGNILITSDHKVKLGDFGIACLTISHGDLSKAELDETFGTPRHMSPEQLNRTSVDNRTDLFSLGVVMYELLSGRHPFPADSYHVLVKNILSSEPPPLSRFRSDLPQEIESIAHKLITKNPADRYQTGNALCTALQPILQGAKKLSIHEHAERVALTKKSGFFALFPESDIPAIVELGEWFHYPKHRVVISEGKLEDSFYIIISGCVEIVKRNQPLALLQKGQCFGEMGYLRRKVRTSSAITRDETELLCLHEEAMQNLPMACQVRFLKLFNSVLVKRLSTAIDTIAGDN